MDERPTLGAVKALLEAAGAEAGDRLAAALLPVWDAVKVGLGCRVEEMGRVRRWGGEGGPRCGRRGWRMGDGRGSINVGRVPASCQVAGCMSWGQVVRLWWCYAGAVGAASRITYTPRSLLSHISLTCVHTAGAAGGAA